MSGSNVKLGLHRGQYVAIWSEDGKRIRRSLGTDNKVEAERQLAHLALTKDILDRQTQKTVEDIYHRYIYEKAQDGQETQPIETIWKRLSPTFGHLYPQYVTPDLVSKYKTDRGVSRGTLFLELGYLRTILRWGFKQQLVKEEIHVKLPSKPPPRTEYITKTDFQKLLTASKQPHIILFMVLAVTTGARSNAIQELTWDRVDLTNRIINFRDPTKHETNKGRAVVPINDTALRYLLEAKKGAQTPYVIEYHNKPVLKIRNSMANISRRVGLHVSAHMFRHSAAVWMAEGGVPMSEISQYLGHTNTAITEKVYARFSPGYLRKAASHLEI